MPEVDTETGEIHESCELNGDATVIERWHWVLANLPGIGKDSTNVQQNFKYRSIDTVLKEVKPLFATAGVFVLPARQKASYVEWQGASGKAVHVTRLEVMWQIWGIKGDHISAETVGEAADAFDKGTSKAQTAAFKYLLWPGLLIADNDDNDGQSPEPTLPRSRASVEEGGAALRERVDNMTPETFDGRERASGKQLAYIRSLARDLSIPSDGSEIQAKVKAMGEPGWPGELSKLMKWQAVQLIDDLKK